MPSADSPPTKNRPASVDTTKPNIARVAFSHFFDPENSPVGLGNFRTRMTGGDGAETLRT